MLRYLTTALVIAAAATTVVRAQDDKMLRAVPSVDYQRYAGTWYEIARLPNRFQRDCASDVTATYSLRSDGRIRVVNRCRKEDGKFKDAEGVARPVKGQPSSVLEVRFAPALLSFLPSVWGDYQIIELGADYDHVLIGTPDRKYLWILARKATLDPEVYQRLVDAARQQGFDVSTLARTTHQGT